MIISNIKNTATDHLKAWSSSMTDLATSQQTRQLEVLVRVSSLLSTLDLDRVLDEVVRLTTEVVGATRGSFFLFNEQQEHLTVQRFLAARNYDPDMKEYVSRRILNEGLAHWVLNARDAAIVEDTLTDSRWITLQGETLITRSALCVPFFFEDQVYGILTLEHPEPGHFQESDKRLAKAVANQASSAMRNAQLFDRTEAQQRQLAAVLTSTTEALFTINRDEKLGLFNPAAEDVFGLRSDDVSGMAVDSLAEYSPMLNEIIAQIRQARLSAGAQSFEVNEKRTRRDFVVSVSVLNPQQSQDVAIVVALHDVTSLKDLSRLKTHMLEMASHDLKNPLGVLLGYLDMMREDIEKGARPDPTFIDGMLRAVDRMDSLIQTLLSHDRIEQHSAQRRQTVDPYILIDQVLEDMNDSAQAKSHTILCEVAPNLPMLSGDPVELREAIDNLVSNAIKYTPYDGTITIHLTAEDGRFFFAVVDTGLGIPADQQAAVFRKYFRAKQAATAEIKGTGLGLSLVKTVVEQHGGNVWFQSAEGVGSTFGFWLPLLAP